MSNFGYAISALGALLIGIIALFIVRLHPLVALIMLAGAGAALAGIAAAWRKYTRRQRRRRSSMRVQI